VTAAGDDDQALARDVDDERLLVQHQRIGLPALIEPGLLRREPRLVPGDVVHQGGHHDRVNRLQDDLDRRLKVMQHRGELVRRALIRAHRPS
jgi:hypothetical protein